jgi:hypothetical protein
MMEYMCICSTILPMWILVNVDSLILVVTTADGGKDIEKWTNFRCRQTV